MVDARSYSLVEIDAMRGAIDLLYDQGGTDEEIRAAIEDKLRTFMFNGTDPAELILAADNVCRGMTYYRRHREKAARMINAAADRLRGEHHVRTQVIKKDNQHGR